MSQEVLSEKGAGERLLEKVKEDIRREYDAELATLRKRDDFSPEFEYFLKILSLSIYPQKFKERFDKRLIGLYCVQIPLELFDAFGFHPLRLYGGSSAVQRLSSSCIPALSCPVIKSCLGSFFLDRSLEKLCDMIIMPTTCDWNVKLAEMTEDKKGNFYVMELPHVRESERGRRRWLEEVYELKRRLQQHTGRKLDCSRLLSSINKYVLAWKAFGRLGELRRKRAISGTWSIVLANAFMLDNVESWSEKINSVLGNYSKSGLADNDNPGIFLAGSPVCFPYLKISELIEKAGMFIMADELCTSERNSVGAAVYDDVSEYGLLTALAEKYRLPCSCPVSMDNDRRIKNILEIMRVHNIKGVVYHLLKGCHPYDIESFHFEKAVKESGFHFIKVETDYSKGDEQNILIRLEAFKETLR